MVLLGIEVAKMCRRNRVMLTRFTFMTRPWPNGPIKIGIFLFCFNIFLSGRAVGENLPSHLAREDLSQSQNCEFKYILLSFKKGLLKIKQHFYRFTMTALALPFKNKKPYKKCI